MTEQNLDPRIGTLTSNGRTVYYAFPKGYGQPEVRGSLAKVEKALGILSKPRENTRRIVRAYIVTVTPRVEAHCGSWASGPYETEVDAYDARDAIKTVRAEIGQRDPFENRDLRPTFRARRAS